MPYIKLEDRPKLTPQTVYTPLDPGALNFAITKLAIDYIADRGKRYATLNEVVGVLECAKLEFYRRLVAEYENEKCKLNGDVY